jgi:TorA maturation chaperone TorD
MVKDELEADTAPNSSTEIHYQMLFEAREVVYCFLAWLFLYPKPDRLEKLKAVASALSRDDWWSDMPFAFTFELLFAEVAAIDDAAIEGIVNEYNRLFLIKPQAPPHETFYLDRSGQLRGWMTSELEGTYAKNGLSISPTLNEMPDHLAVELEFMSHLCSVATTGDCEMIEAAIKSQRAFLTQHLAKWFPKFAKRVKEAEPQYHYGVTVEATFAFLRNDLASFN